MDHLDKRSPRGDFSLKTLAYGGLIKILLTRQGEKDVELTGYEKVNNPVLALHGESLFVVWEHYGENSQLRFVKIGKPNTGEPEKKIQAKWLNQDLANPPCYRPRLCSHGNDLLLVYEQFINREYRITGRFWKENDFSPPFLLADNRGNNQEPCIESLAKPPGFLLSYENSQPLYKDYVWISPRGDKVVIPGFGHGWRVETRSFLKKITITDSKVIMTDRGEGDRILTGEEESSGCPRVIDLDEPLVDIRDSSLTAPRLAVVFCALDGYMWTIRYAIYNGQSWSDSIDTGLLQERRVTPQAWYDRERHTLMIKSPYPPVDEPEEKEIYLHPFSDTKENISSQRGGATFFSKPVPCPSLVLMPEKRSVFEIDYQDKKLKLFWGDLHMHSNISKCSLHSKFHCVEPEEKFRQSRDVGRLDFAMLTDHDSMTDQEWERTRSQVDFYNQVGIFTVFHGFEWTATHGPGPKQGHYNVLYRDKGRLYRVKEEDGCHINKIWEDLIPGDALTIPHHPADETHTLDWNFFDPRFEPLVEIFQVRGSYEYPGNSLDPSNFRPEKMVPGASILEALEKGYEFGFTAGGEHEGVGTTAVFALENTREALFDGLKKRQVYGTTGDHILMDFRINGTLMGGVIHEMEGDPEISIVIEGTAPIEELRIMRDGKKIFSRNYEKSQINIKWIDHDFTRIKEQRKTHYYYLVVEQVNGEAGWASPIFIKG